MFFYLHNQLESLLKHPTSHNLRDAQFKNFLANTLSTTEKTNLSNISTRIKSIREGSSNTTAIIQAYHSNERKYFEQQVKEDSLDNLFYMHRNQTKSILGFLASFLLPTSKAFQTRQKIANKIDDIKKALHEADNALRQLEKTDAFIKAFPEKVKHNSSYSKIAVVAKPVSTTPYEESINNEDSTKEKLALFSLSRLKGAWNNLRGKKGVEVPAEPKPIAPFIR